MNATTSTNMTHQPTIKAISHLRSRLLGAAMANPNWYTAVNALEYAIESHAGVMRKDGITPYILHPVQVALYILTLPNLMFPIETVAAALLHDVMEDCNVTHPMLASKFNSLIADAVELLSKKYDGTTKSETQVFRELALSCISSIVKGADRINNQSTMIGVFSAEKALSTVDFTEMWILTMLKSARRKFPQQELAYENIKLVLELQLSLVRELHKPLES